MARPELGIKRQCMNCGAKFYDLARDPATCPKCGTVFQLATGRGATPALARKNEEEEEEESGPDVVSLDEVEASEDADDNSTDDDSGDNDSGSAGDDDAFLEEEDNDDDVSDLIDNDGDGDEEN